MQKEQLKVVVFFYLCLVSFALFVFLFFISLISQVISWPRRFSKRSGLVWTCHWHLHWQDLPRSVLVKAEHSENNMRAWNREMPSDEINLLLSCEFTWEAAVSSESHPGDEMHIYMTASHL